jgi:hypothetical protein
VARDLRYAGRQLWKNPGFVLTAVITLALGISANTALFSLVKTVLLTPPPYPDPGEAGSRVVVDARARLQSKLDIDAGLSGDA